MLRYLLPRLEFLKLPQENGASDHSLIEQGGFEVKRLLCVDDSPDMLDMLVDLLESEFQIVGTLSSGSSALNEVGRCSPDIILLDVDLGDMSGFFVAEQLRRTGCAAKIVFLSIHQSIEFMQAAHELGAAGYVAKSHISRDLVKVLHEAV